MQTDINVPDEQFSNLITEIKKAHRGCSNLSKDDLKTMTGQVFGTLRTSMENLIDCVDQAGDEEINSQPAKSSVNSLNYIKPDNALDKLQSPTREITTTACDIEDEGTSGPAVAATPARPQTRPGVQAALGALDRIAGQLKSFYQWLKEKFSKAVSEVWQSVRKAFSTMLAWIRGVCKEVQSALAVPLKASAKVHVA